MEDLATDHPCGRGAIFEAFEFFGDPIVAGLAGTDLLFEQGHAFTDVLGVLVEGRLHSAMPMDMAVYTEFLLIGEVVLKVFSKADIFGFGVAVDQANDICGVSGVAIECAAVDVGVCGDDFACEGIDGGRPVAKGRCAVWAVDPVEETITDIADLGVVTGLSTDGGVAFLDGVVEAEDKDIALVFARADLYGFTEELVPLADYFGGFGLEFSGILVVEVVGELSDLTVGMREASVGLGALCFIAPDRPAVHGAVGVVFEDAAPTVVSVADLAEVAEFGHTFVVIGFGLVIGAGDTLERGAYFDGLAHAVACDLGIQPTSRDRSAIIGRQFRVNFGLDGEFLNDINVIFADLGAVFVVDFVFGDVIAHRLLGDVGRDKSKICDQVLSKVHAKMFALIPRPIHGVFDDDVVLFACGGVITALDIKVAFDAKGGDRRAFVFGAGALAGFVCVKDIFS